MTSQNAPSTSCPDDLLVVRCQARDEAAYRELVRRWEPRLYYYLRRLIDDESAVWDVLQNTWLAVFRHLSRLEDARKFRGWVYRIAHDQGVNWWQKEKRYAPQPEEELEPLIGNEAPNPVNSEDIALLHQALQGLSPPHREVLALFYLEGFSSPEIAKVVGLPEGTVRSRLHHARGNLAAALKGLGYERAR